VQASRLHRGNCRRDACTEEIAGETPAPQDAHMATIIHAADAHHRPQAAAFNFDDFAAQARLHLAGARAEAAEIVARAVGEADCIHRQAEEAGRNAALQEVEAMVAGQMAPPLAALRQAVADLHDARQQWLSHWEAAAVRLAAAIAQRVIRRELRVQPEITLALVREALELAAGSPTIRVHLNPEDYKLLGTQVRGLIDAISALGGAEVVSDAAIGQGGSRVETRFGTIDQQIESQLKRIEEELIG
jgi:flagellar assembly protein FliH